MKKINMYILCLGLCVVIFLGSINHIVGQYYMIPILSKIFSYILLIGQCSIVYSITLSILEIKKDVLFIIIVSLSIISITYLFYNQNMVYFEQFYFFYYFKYGLAAYVLIRQNRFIKSILNSFLLFFSLAVSTILIYIKFQDITAIPYMDFGFALVTPILVLMYLLIIEKKIWLIPIILIYSSILIMYSNRGVILSVLVFIMLYIFKMRIDDKLNKKIMINYLIGLSGIFLIFISYKKIINKILVIMENSQINSRTLKLWVEGNLSNDSGRSTITNFFISKIFEKPFGFGIYGDRLLYERYQGIPMYPHNIILEILIDFGVLIGGIIVAIFTYIIITKFILNKKLSIEYYLLISVFFSVSIILLLISSSFLASIPLWIFIALIFTKEKDLYTIDNKEVDFYE